jgi:hypothetical protein
MQPRRKDTCVVNQAGQIALEQEEFNTFSERLTASITKAVKNAREDHFRQGQPVVVVQNGKLTKWFPSKNLQ